MKNYVLILLTILAIRPSAFAEESGLPVHGFLDAVAGNSDSKAQGTNKYNGVSIGTVDFYLNPEFEGGVKSLIELAFEGKRSDGTIGVDVERLQLGYQFSDSATLWIGRFHTPYGVWNTAFHHGAQLQTSVLRPRFLDFEDLGGVLPAHTVGAWLHGKIEIVGDHRLIYDLYSGNGPQIHDNTLDPNLIMADRQSSLIGLNLGYQIGDLRLGVHGFHTLVNNYGAGAGSYGGTPPVSQSDVQMMGGYAFYEGDRVEVDSEYYGFSNKNVNLTTATKGDGISSFATFTQIAVPVGKFKPYARMEKFKGNQNDGYFANQDSGHSYDRSAFGLRYDLNTKAALKLEGITTKYTEDVASYDYSFSSILLQYAARF